MDRADAYGHVHDGGQSRGRDDGHGRDDDGGHYPTDMRRYRNYRIICNLRHCCRGRKRPALRRDDGDFPALDQHPPQNQAPVPDTCTKRSSYCYCRQ